MQLKGKTAFITGASSGIGEAIAYELAQHGANLILTARSTAKLQAIAVAIRQQHGVVVHVFPGDLARKETAQTLYEQVKRAGLTVDVLVNNAGFGKWTHFLDQSSETYEQMVELNVNSVLKLTHLFLPDLLRRGEGGILNVASTGSFQPCPYITTYCATKAFVLSFSEGLHGEYAQRGVTVTALCPGNTDTGFQATAAADTKGMRSDTSARVAREGIQALLRGKSFHVVGADNYLQSLLPRWLPRKTVINLVGSMMSKKLVA